MIMRVIRTSLKALPLWPALLLCLLPLPAHAGNAEITIVEDAAAVISEIMNIPEQSIPPSLLDGARGVAIIPGVIKAGFFVGARYGEGIVVVKNDQGRWSNPVFVTLIGGSFGFQFGAQATDIILVFNTNRSIDALCGGQFTLGADISAAAGPVGRHAEAATDLLLRTEILSYSRSRGLFAGAALEGASIHVDYKSTSAFYNMAGLLPLQIFRSPDLQAPAVVDDLKRILERAAGR